MELRADKLPAEYLKKARDCDQDFCGTARGTVGPVDAKLRSYPPLLKLVSGTNAWIPMSSYRSWLTARLSTSVEARHPS